MGKGERERERNTLRRGEKEIDNAMREKRTDIVDRGITDVWANL